MTEKQITPSGVLNKIIESLMEERLFYTAYNKTQETTEYDKWREESISLSDGIKNVMGPEQNIFTRYEELSTLCGNALLQNAYKQGFMDGIKLLKGILSLEL